MKCIGIHSFEAARYAIGYILNGYMHIYSGDVRHTAGPGDIFFLGKGTHYIEEEPAGRKPFEQLMFFYSPEQMGKIISQLNLLHNMDLRIHHSCKECLGKEYVIAHGNETFRHFFDSVNRHLTDGLFRRDPTLEMLKLTELAYHIATQPEGCMRTKMLGSTDPEKEYFEKSVSRYIFSDITLEELAKQNNRSLTSFKNFFKAYFHESPHRWVVHQRLMHARLLLISTNKPIAQIGAECRFPNTSHFIKLFRKEFDMTPACYRKKYSSDLTKRTTWSAKHRAVEMAEA